MKIIKKNQLAVLVISLMLITAGYLNYDTTIKGKIEEASTNIIDVASIGDAKLVSTDVVEENNITNDVSDNKTSDEVKNVAETNAQIKADTNNKGDDYFVTSKLERNIMYSQMIDRYQKMLDSASADSDQKAIAGQEIDRLNEIQNAIMIAENLLSTKGFKDSIIFVNGESISIIIGKEELTPTEIAQIQNIISRELNAKVENIHISTK